MLGTIAVQIGGGHYMDALASDYFEQALSRMMETISCSGNVEDGADEEITYQVLKANRLRPSRQVRYEFNELVSSFRLPAARLMFKPGPQWGINPGFHAVVQDLIEEEGGHVFSLAFNWIYETPAAKLAIEQAFELVLADLHRLEAKYLPHLRQALERHPYAPDYAFLTGLQAAGFELDLDKHRWLWCYGFKPVTKEGKILFAPPMLGR